MAKKARTPSPPRKVQAPKRRDQPRPRRGPAPPGQDRSRLYLYAFAAAGIIGVVVAVIVVLSGGNSSSSAPGQAGVAVPNLARLPGGQTGSPPWPANNRKVRERSTILGLPMNQQANVHYHAHLDVYDNGQPVTVPSQIGISQKEQVLSVLHTHDPSGIVHIEAGQAYPYTLGQFFGVWGVNLSRKCIGGLCSKPLQTWVDGHLFKHDPTRLILESHQEIALVYGTPPSKIPTSYSFPAGY